MDDSMEWYCPGCGRSADDIAMCGSQRCPDLERRERQERAPVPVATGSRTPLQADTLERMLSPGWTDLENIKKALKVEVERADRAEADLREERIAKAEVTAEAGRLRAALAEAKDYVGKNYMPSGLIARIEAALRRKGDKQAVAREDENELKA